MSIRSRVVSMIILLAGVWGSTQAAMQTKYVVEPGDSLSKIAISYYGSALQWRPIYQANKDRISNPDVIMVGQKLTIPSMGDGQKPLEEQRSISVVTGTKYAPYVDKDLYRKGLTHQVVDVALNRGGYKPLVRYKDWGGMLDRVREGEVLAAFPFLKDPNRSGLRYSDRLTDILIRVFVTKDSDLAYREPADLNGHSVCKPEGFFTHDVSDLDVTIKRAASLEGCFTQLKRGQVDAVTANRFSAWTAVQKADNLSPKTFRIMPHPVHKGGLYLVTARGSQQGRKLLEDFNEALEVMKEQGYVNTVRTDQLERYQLRFGFANWQEKSLPDPHKSKGDDVRMVSGNQYPPFSDSDLKAGGMMTQIVRKALNRMGKGLSVDLMGWGEGKEKAAAGEFMGMYPYVSTRDRRQDFWVSESLYYMPVRIFIRHNYEGFPMEDGEPIYRAMFDVKGMTACKPQGYYIKDIAPHLSSNLIEVKRPESMQRCFEMLHNKEVDFVTANRYTGWGAADQADIPREDFELVNEPIIKAHLRLMVSKERGESGKQFLKAFNEQIKEMQRKGILKEMQESYQEYYVTHHGFPVRNMAEKQGGGGASAY